MCEVMTKINRQALLCVVAGTLIGGALFHMMPAAVEHMGNELNVYLWIAAGFVGFFILEHNLQWHHCHLPGSAHETSHIGHMILIADGVHNLIGGLSIGALFIADFRLGFAA